MRHFFILFAIAGLLINPSAAEACTGITLKSKDSTTIVARTIEWGGSMSWFQEDTPNDRILRMGLME